jgi:hypothetical protein
MRDQCARRLMKRITVTVIVLSLTIANTFAQNYQGKPYNNKTQSVPGKIQCELYDLGGEGISYHDKDSINNGSGKLNPANGTFLNEFRMKEGVDISFTKPSPVDLHQYNKVQPVLNELYVGWTEPGEWINYTIKVKKTGQYTLALMYTASGDGKISFEVDGKKITDDLLIPSTRSDEETIQWRQWHHWNRIDPMATVALKKGTHILTIRTIDHGNMNYDYVDFQLKSKQRTGK